MGIPRSVVIGCCACLLVAAAAHAADGPPVGVTAGVNLASVNLSGLDSTGINSNIRAGLFVGGFAWWEITPDVAIQPEIVYTQQRFNLQDTVSGFTPTEAWDWIEVPVLARIGVWRSGTRQAYVVVGPGFGVLLRAHEDAAGVTSDVSDDISRLNVSIVAGGGLSFGQLGVEARYDNGFTDLNKDYRLGDLLTVKRRTVTIDVTWRFR